MKIRDSTDIADQRKESHRAAMLIKKATQDYFNIVNFIDLSGKHARHLFHIAEVTIMTILYIMEKNRFYLNRAKQTKYSTFFPDLLRNHSIYLIGLEQ